MAVVCSGCYLEYCLHLLTKRTVAVNTEKNTPDDVCGAVGVTTRGHAVKKERSKNREKNRNTSINDRQVFPHCLTQRCSTAMIPCPPLKIAGVIPRVYNSPTLHRPVTSIPNTYQVPYYCLVKNKNQTKDEDCFSGVMVSPAFHPPERPTPLAISLRGHASQHALQKQRGERRC